MRKIQTEEEKQQKKQNVKDKNLYSTYGITRDEWTNILIRQEGTCYICRQMPKSGILCVDHIHVLKYKSMLPEQRKKYVRGLLCYMCNTALKGVEKTSDGKRNRAMLNGIVRYFEAYPLKGEI